MNDTNRVCDAEYRRAKTHIEILRAAINVSHERIMEMLEDVAAEKSNCDLYKRQLEYNLEVVARYEKEQKKKGDV